MPVSKSTTFKRCGRCRESKSLSEFSKDKSTTSGYACYCLKCRRTKDPEKQRAGIVRVSKKCQHCKQVKLFSEFYSFEHVRRNGNKEVARSANCKVCNSIVCRQRHREKIESGEAVREYKRRYKKKRWEKLLKQYGITQEEYEQLESEQEFKCAICGQPETRMYKDVLCRLVVDHDHKTGMIRGLLCCSCNLVIGYAKDRIETLRGAITYLEQHKER